MINASQNDDLKAAFEKHRGETEGQVKRLEQVFSIIEEKSQGKTCDAIMGIVKEGEGIIEEYKGSRALDAGLLAVAQAVEHYEISRYGTLKAWAEELGHEDAAELLGETLKEEKDTDAALSKLAEFGHQPRGRSRSSLSHETTPGALGAVKCAHVDARNGTQ